MSRPAYLSEQDELDLQAYLVGDLTVKRLMSPDLEGAQIARDALERDGLSPERVATLARKDKSAAIRSVLGGTTGVNATDEYMDRCARLLRDDAVLDYMVAQLAECMVETSGLSIGGVALRGNQDEG